MPGQYGSNSYTIYRKELEKVVDQLRHEKMMEIDPQYAQQFAKLTAKEASRGDRLLALKQMQKRLKAQGFDKPQSIGKIQFKKNHGNRDKMIISCLPMVVSVAKKILWNSKSSVQFDDLIQSGNLGLVIAADNYLNTAFPADATPAKFSTYAYFWIYKYIFEESVRSGTILSGTKRDVYDANRYTQIVVQKSHDDDDELPNDRWDMKTAKDFSELHIIEDEAKRFRHESEKLFKVLSKQEKRIIFLLYGIDTPKNIIYTQAEIAQIVGKSPAQISKDIKNIIWKLQHFAKDFVNGEDLIATLSILQGVDLSKVDFKDWTMASTM
jgi:RNA polymerase sigma factor (sigma-70 family)